MSAVRSSDPGQWEERSGRAIALAFGEELLLRGFVFAPIAVHSFWAAIAANFAVSFLLAAGPYRGKEELLYRPGIKGIEATFLALLYSWNRALAVVCVARLVLETVRPIALARPEMELIARKVAAFRRRKISR